MATKPTQALIDFAAQAVNNGPRNKTNLEEPTNDLKNVGWLPQAIERGHLNWMFKWLFAWAKYFEQSLDEDVLKKAQLLSSNSQTATDNTYRASVLQTWINGKFDASNVVSSGTDNSTSKVYSTSRVTSLLAGKAALTTAISSTSNVLGWTVSAIINYVNSRISNSSSSNSATTAWSSAAIRTYLSTFFVSKSGLATSAFTNSSTTAAASNVTFGISSRVDRIQSSEIRVRPDATVNAQLGLSQGALYGHRDPLVNTWLGVDMSLNLGNLAQDVNNRIVDLEARFQNNGTMTFLGTLSVDVLGTDGERYLVNKHIYQNGNNWWDVLNITEDLLPLLQDHGVRRAHMTLKGALRTQGDGDISFYFRTPDSVAGSTVRVTSGFVSYTPYSRTQITNP